MNGPGFKAWETSRGGREESRARIRPVVHNMLQEHPTIDLADLLSELFSTVLMDDVGQWETEADLALGKLCVSLCVASENYSISRMPTVIPGVAHSGVTRWHINARWLLLLGFCARLPQTMQLRDESEANISSRVGTFRNQEVSLSTAWLCGSVTQRGRGWRTVKSCNGHSVLEVLIGNRL